MTHLEHPYFRIEWYESLPSTNALAKEKVVCAIRNNETIPPLVIVCGEQLRGYGTHGRSWISLPGNLMASLLLPMGKIVPSHTGDLALVTGLGVATWVQEACPRSQITIKWPNDILIQGRKCGGILIEIEPPYMIIGLGLNLCAAPETIPETTFVNCHSNTPLSVERALSPLLDAILCAYEDYRSYGLSHLVPSLLPFMITKAKLK